tara:strand:- start:100 stop:630 length:531 start_codon:yes stop_codon:yes gene_type:complete
MKEFKSVGLNFFMSGVLLAFVFSPLYIDEFADFLLTDHNYLYAIGGCFIYALFCITVVRVNREGIKKELYLAPIVLKSKTWREIKYYAHVEELWSGRYGTQLVEVVWFIDFNDKVCLRIRKSFRKNLDKVIEIIDEFEDKYEIKLEIKDPYLMAYGYSKVKYPNKKLEDDKKESKK